MVFALRTQPLINSWYRRYREERVWWSSEFSRRSSRNPHGDLSTAKCYERHRGFHRLKHTAVISPAKHQELIFTVVKTRTFLCCDVFSSAGKWMENAHAFVHYGDSTKPGETNMGQEWYNTLGHHSHPKPRDGSPIGEFVHGMPFQLYSEVSSSFSLGQTHPVSSCPVSCANLPAWGTCIFRVGDGLPGLEEDGSYCFFLAIGVWKKTTVRKQSCRWPAIANFQGSSPQNYLCTISGVQRWPLGPLSEPYRRGCPYPIVSLGFPWAIQGVGGSVTPELVADLADDISWGLGREYLQAQVPVQHRNWSTWASNMIFEVHAGCTTITSPIISPIIRGVFYKLPHVAHTMTGWWFGTFFTFPYIGNNHPNWLIFFRGAQTTNQMIYASADFMNHKYWARLMALWLLQIMFASDIGWGENWSNGRLAGRQMWWPQMKVSWNTTKRIVCTGKSLTNG